MQRSEAWPELLQTRLGLEGFPHRVINASMSGETSSGGRSRLKDELTRHRPEILILELGANDGLRGMNLQILADNLTVMVDSATQSGSTVLLIGMQLPPNYGPAYTRRFAAVFAEVAQSRRIAFVPFLMEGFASRTGLFQPDGLHPVAAAQPLMLDTVWRQLRPLLNGKRSSGAKDDAPAPTRSAAGSPPVPASR